MSIKSALRDWLSVSQGLISILVISRCAAPPYPAAPDFLHGKACHTILRSLCFLTNRVPLPPHPGDRINRSMLSCRDMAPLLSTHLSPACGGKVVAPATKGGISHARQGGWPVFLGRSPVVRFSPPKAAFILAPLGAPTSPAGTVSQPIGKPFNGQAKGLLWLTWRSYAGPPQYYITPEGESPEPACKAKPITGRTLAAQGRKARRLAQPSRP